MARVLRQDGETVQVREVDLIDLEHPDPDAAYTLRVFTQDKYRDIEKANTEYVLNKHTHQRQEKVDERAQADDLVDYAIADWTGVIGPDGQPLPCTREYKLRLDGFVRAALVRHAGANELARTPAERKAESFREPGGVS